MFLPKSDYLNISSHTQPPCAVLRLSFLFTTTITHRKWIDKSLFEITVQPARTMHVLNFLVKILDFSDWICLFAGIY